MAKQQKASFYALLITSTKLGPDVPPGPTLKGCQEIGRSAGRGGGVVLSKYHNLLLQVYVIFCDRFYHGENPLPDILTTSTRLKKSSLKMSHEKNIC